MRRFIREYQAPGRLVWRPVTALSQAAFLPQTSGRTHGARAIRSISCLAAHGKIGGLFQKVHKRFSPKVLGGSPNSFRAFPLGFS